MTAASSAWSLVLLLAMGGAATAGDVPCLADTRRLCPLVPTGLVQACLQAHVDELSAECRKRVGEVNASIERLQRDCETDAERLCPEPQTQAGQRAACLLKHRASLSAGCRRSLDAVSER